MFENRCVKILVFGHSSFAAQGLVGTLRGAGHEVTTFSRGAERWDGSSVTGRVDSLLENPYLAGGFDVLVNYIVLKDQGVEKNVRFAETLLRFCEQRGVNHLIHISSVSVYESTARRIDENTCIESRLGRKGVYAAVKVAVDAFLLENQPESLRLSLVRPGFILGSGLINPMPGIGTRLPNGMLLSLGHPHSQLPLIERSQVNEAIKRIIEAPEKVQHSVYLLVNPDSPSRSEYLRACSTELGAGESVLRLPGVFWFLLGYGFDLGERVLRRALPKGMSRAFVQRYDPARTEKLLRLNLRFDWKRALSESSDRQLRNFDLPYEPDHLMMGPTHSLKAECVAFLGAGRIVQTKHIPALAKCKYHGKVCAYDLQPGLLPPDTPIHTLEGVEAICADLHVVATPGPVHCESLKHLNTPAGSVLVEKPLCYTPDEFSRWLNLSRLRGGRIFVCHNYRLKRNVVEMLQFLGRHNPGNLLHVQVHFQSPPVSSELAIWMRDERTARTLLMDYGLHFLDLACMFARTPWHLRAVESKRNSLGQTALISGEAASETYGLSFLLRQGFAPRTARLVFTFQNYLLELGFFPDFFVPHLSSDNPVMILKEASASARATVRKLADKLLGKDSDDSHSKVFQAVLSQDHALLEHLSVPRLREFYELLFAIGTDVYGGATG